MTAWHALVEFGGVKSGDTVLTLGTGGVSTFAIQLAKLHGARAIATSSSDEKLAKVRELGADEVINYKATPDWDKQVLRLTDRIGIDHVVEVGRRRNAAEIAECCACGWTGLPDRRACGR